MYIVRKVDNKQTTENITFSNGKATIKLKDKEQITIKDLPYGTTYIVKELDTDGFIVKYQVNGGVIEIYDAKKQKSYTLNDNMEIKFTNVSGYELPATGSSGMLILIIMGSLLLAVPVIYISINVLNKKLGVSYAKHVKNYIYNKKLCGAVFYYREAVDGIIFLDNMTEQEHGTDRL